MIPVAKPYLSESDAQSAYDTILTGWITQGPRVAEFERNFADYTGARFAVAVSNCTTALHLAMIVAGIGPGDEVICPSMSYIATANAIVHAGATPVFAEILPEDYNLDPADAEKRITPRTKAILLVHQLGMPANIDAFASLCSKYNLKLIEDAACAIGSRYKGRKIGCHSDLVCFSFHPRKVITTGDGGMITTSNESYFERLKLLRQHGMSVNDRVRHESKKLLLEDHVEVAYNYRLTDIQASVGIRQLEKLDWIIEQRRKIAVQYSRELGDIECLRLPSESPDCFSNFQSYSIYLKNTCRIERNDLIEKLLEEGISTRRGVMTAHRETAYSKRTVGLSLPISEDASDQSVILPLYVGLEEREVSYITGKIRALLA